MKKSVKCELCESGQLIKKDGCFQCECCGTKYTLEEARKLLVNDEVPEKTEAAVPETKKSVPAKDPEREKAEIKNENIIYDDPIFNIHNGVLDKYNGNEIDVIVPDKVTKIGDYAFSNNRFIEKIIIPEGVQSIGDYAFLNCSSLKSADIPNSITAIGTGAFRNCTSLEKVNISDSMVSISDFTFANCKSIKRISIPVSVTSIGDCAFDNCSSLDKVSIPNSVISIGKWAFRKCISMYRMELPDSLTSVGSSVLKDTPVKRRMDGVCQHCGGYFTGIFTRVCSECGKPKDY